MLSFLERQGQRTVAFQKKRQILLAESKQNLEHVREENIMRKVSLGMNVTLDGFVAGPNGELDWAFRTMSPDLGEWVIELLRGVDTILIGHNTYMQQVATWPTQTNEMATLLNSHAKIVFSRRLTSLEWNNSRLAAADAAEEIARLKQEPGKDISVTGGATLGSHRRVQPGNASYCTGRWKAALQGSVSPAQLEAGEREDIRFRCHRSQLPTRLA